jgi:hypothetical protein
MLPVPVYRTTYNLQRILPHELEEARVARETATPIKVQVRQFDSDKSEIRLIDAMKISVQGKRQAQGAHGNGYTVMSDSIHNCAERERIALRSGMNGWMDVVLAFVELMIIVSPDAIQSEYYPHRHIFLQTEQTNNCSSSNRPNEP